MGSFAFTNPEQWGIEHKILPQSVGSRVIERRENPGNFSSAASPVTTSPSQVPQCGICGKFHWGGCRSGSRRYFKCGQKDNQRKDCPNKALARGLSPKSNAPQRFQNKGDSYIVDVQASKERISTSGQGARPAKPNREARGVTSYPKC